MHPIPFYSASSFARALFSCLLSDVHSRLYCVVSKIEDVATIKESSWVPAQDIVISDCGEIKILNIEDEPSGP